MQDLTTFLAEWANAERTKDTGFLEDNLTDDFPGVGPLGFTLPKPAWLARHHTGELDYQTFALDETQTRLHGNTAIVTARQTTNGTYQGHPMPEALRATLVLTQDGVGWRLAGVHMSFIAGTPGAPPLPDPRRDN